MYVESQICQSPSERLRGGFANFARMLECFLEGAEAEPPFEL